MLVEIMAEIVRRQKFTVSYTKVVHHIVDSDLHGHLMSGCRPAPCADVDGL